MKHKPKLDVNPVTPVNEQSSPEVECEKWIEAHMARVRRIIESSDPAQQPTMCKAIDGLFEQAVSALEKHDQWQTNLQQEAEEVSRQCEGLRGGNIPILGKAIPQIGQRLAMLEIESNTKRAAANKATADRPFVVQAIRQAATLIQAAQRLTMIIRLYARVYWLPLALKSEIMPQQQATLNARQGMMGTVQQLGNSPIAQELRDYARRLNVEVDQAIGQAQAVELSQHEFWGVADAPFRNPPIISTNQPEPVPQGDNGWGEFWQRGRDNR